MNRIRQLRIDAGLTQTELGKLLNVKDAAISKYENEKIPLTAETLIKLKNIFGVSIDYILGASELKKHPENAHDNTSMAVSQISKDLAAIVKYYNQLSGNGQEKALEYIQMLKEYEQAKEKKND